MSGDLQKYRITKINAQLRRQENGAWKVYRGPAAYGAPRDDGSSDTIMLTEAQAKSPTIQTLLKPVPINRAPAPTVYPEDANL